MADDERDRAEPEDDSGGLTPDEIASRSFSAARRGIAEPEVRAFLREVADEIATLEARADDEQERLRARIAGLERQLQEQSKPRRPTEEEMVAALGDETARVLRSAQEAAEEIKANAAARIEGLVAEAEAEAARLRESAERVMEDRSREADVAATVKLQEAESQSVARLRQATRDAEAEVEAARQRGREMVGEARAVRERILADLGKRRSTLQAEVTQLEGARERLLSAGRTVKRTLADAAQALSPFEVEEQPAVPEPSVAETVPEADAEPAIAPPLATTEDLIAETEAERAPETIAPGPAAERERPSTGLRSYLRTAGHPSEAPEPEASEGPAEVPSTSELQELRGSGEPPSGRREAKPIEAGPPAEGARPEEVVEDLFARIRADREQAVGDARAALEVAPKSVETAPASVEGRPAPTRDPPPAPTPSAAPARAPEPVAKAKPAAPRDDSQSRDRQLHERRNEVLAPIAQELVRKCKRALQDEQNVLLDRLRRQRGSASGENLLVPLSVQVTDWADVLEPSVDEAYSAGRGSQLPSGPDGVRVPRRLVSGLAEVVVRPLRDRLSSSIDAAPGEPGPERESELSTRVGARYREWRAQELELRVGDVLAAAYARGVYDIAPEDAQLRWIPAESGRCPDCDDNALEPTARGAKFPTGQALPPAHPGCRCLIAVVGSA